MTKLGSVFALTVCLGSLSLAQGCSSPKSSGFEEDEIHNNRAGNDGGVSGDRGGMTFGDSGAGSVLEAGCATATATTSRAPVYMEIGLDGSGSMESDNKWTSVVPALDAIFDDLKAKADPSFAVGLIAFSDDNDPTCPALGGNCKGPYPSAIDVPIAIVDDAQHAKLRARIDTSGPNGGTPTLAGLSGGYSVLDTFVPSGALPPGGKKVLVLMTDGVPNGGPAEQTLCASAATSKLAQAGSPITTFAVGIGVFPTTDVTAYDPAFMGRLAQAGGAAPAGCDPSESADAARVCHFQVTPNGKSVAQITQDFIEAVNKIRGAVASCDFLLAKPEGGGSVDPTKINVNYKDGTGKDHILTQDSGNGWTYDDPSNPSRVILHGTSCDSVKADPAGKISIILGCKTVTN